MKESSVKVKCSEKMNVDIVVVFSFCQLPPSPAC